MRCIFYFFLYINILAWEHKNFFVDNLYVYNSHSLNGDLSNWWTREFGICTLFELFLQVLVSSEIPLYGLELVGILIKCVKFALASECIDGFLFCIVSFRSSCLTEGVVSFLNGTGDFLKQFDIGAGHGGHTEDAVDMESMHWTEQHFLLDVEDSSFLDAMEFCF